MAYTENKEEEKTLERAQKDAEMVSEYAKDARNRKEAEKISNKLEDEIEIKEYAVENVLDETKNNIRQTTKEAQRDTSVHTDVWRYTGRIHQDHKRIYRHVHTITKRYYQNLSIILVSIY